MNASAHQQYRLRMQSTRCCPEQTGMQLSWITEMLQYQDILFCRTGLYIRGIELLLRLIDLPGWFGQDLLVINSHLKCCGGQTNDDKRQLEVDATIAFILDAKTPGGVIDLPTETPFVILGDLNLVGDRQQLITLLTGEIINTPIFGNGGPPDWDNTDLEDLLSQTNR